MDSGGQKRAVDRASNGNKARRLSGDVIAAMEKDMLRRSLETNFEPLIRRVVVEELDRVLSKVEVQYWRLPQWQITGNTSAASRQFCLHFISSPAVESTFTDTKLEGECGDTIRVMLVDVAMRQLVIEGRESTAELEVVPVMGDFNIPDDGDWTADEFERHVAKEREGKAQLLAGQLKVYLKGGLGTLGHLYFTDNSRRTRSRKFRLGVRVAQDNGAGLANIREGISQAFFVKDSRGRGYGKHDIPKADDEVWRLRHIAKDKQRHQDLARNGIHTVKDFLCWLHERPGDLKEVLGKMAAKKYEDAVAHAKKCLLGEMYFCPVNQPPIEQVIINQNYQTVGAVAHGQYVGLDMLNEYTEKVQMDACVKTAYNNWGAGANKAECMVDVVAASAEEPLDILAAPTGTAYDRLASDVVQDVEPLTLHVQEPEDNWAKTIAMAANPCSSDELISTPFWEDYKNIMISDSWKYESGGGIFPDVGVENEELSPYNVARHVNEVLWEDSGGYGLAVFGDPRLDIAPTPPTSRWWLRIRAVVRCALFIRNARFMQQQQSSHYHTSSSIHSE